ncbi:fimbrillin family protein [Prevotella brunnea]|uniref:fimbrillin family protein n=1 Tax=Prevotella brunnea TaxID=2508867 RepID=UPI0028343E64|nr:fimbrillin family protein [Prevotella brunnea]MDR0185777.1 fimbrillin family protein [Prevotella brunnea]
MRRKIFISIDKALNAVLMSLLTAGMVGVAVSCSDDLGEGNGNGTSIDFSVSVPDNGYNSKTRSSFGQTGKLMGLTVSNVKGATSDEGKPLYLHTIITDGFGTDDGQNVTELSDDSTTVPGTRATPVTSATMYSNATAFASAYPKDKSWDGTDNPGYFFDLQISKSNGWNTNQPWPGAQWKMAFFAYAPHHCPGVSLTTNTNSPGAPTFRYTVPNDAKQQTDLLTASVTNLAGNSKMAAPLRFRHALTAVRFETGDAMRPGTVKSITFKGVYGTAVHRIGEATWSGYTNVRNFSQTLNVSTSVPNVAGQPITPKEGTFMMIPQKLPVGASIEVKYVDKLSGAERTLTASIANTTWGMGKTVTYRISTSSIAVAPTLIVTPPANYTYQGGTKPYKVTSYATVAGGGVTKTVPVAWTTEYSTNGGTTWSKTKPSWLTAFTGGGQGGTTETSYNATVARQTLIPDPKDTHTVALRNATAKTNWNLSNASGANAVQNTANCYIINASGTYRLPLVYGNAVKNGTANTSAYTSSKTGTFVLKTFINHLGKGITNPYIYNNAGCTPANATLVWQDAKNLVSNVKLSADKHFITFSVERASIRQGNAVVAVRDAANNVMWSWQIWVTDYKLGTGLKTLTNYQGNKRVIMSQPIGWCSGTKDSYAARKVMIRFRQSPPSGYNYTKEQTITLNQLGNTITYIGNNTLYQWGRKDPFPGALGVGDTKYWYDAQGKKHSENLPTEEFSLGNACITSCIKKPGVYCTNKLMDDQYYNLWNANRDFTSIKNSGIKDSKMWFDIPVVKTIYDPSPMGFSLPRHLTFTGFSKTGVEALDPTELNTTGTYNHGWSFYVNPNNKAEGTIFIPTLFVRSASGEITWDLKYLQINGDAPEHSHFWKEGCYDNRKENGKEGAYLCVADILCTPYGRTRRSFGFGVLPEKE